MSDRQTDRLTSCEARVVARSAGDLKRTQLASVFIEEAVLRITMSARRLRIQHLQESMRRLSSTTPPSTS